MSNSKTKREEKSSTDAYWCEVCGTRFASEVDPKECPACKASRIDIVQIYTENDATLDAMRSNEDYTAGD